MTSASGLEDEDLNGLARAYNQSIYLMLGVPCVMLSAIGLLVWRQVRLLAMLPPGELPLLLSPGDRTCPTPCNSDNS